MVNQNIHVANSWSSKDGYSSTKSNKVRTISFCEDLKYLLVELRNMGPFKENLKVVNGSSLDFDDLVLPRYTEWRNGAQSKVTKAFLKRIGVKEVRFHDLRATFMTNLLLNGESIPKVMQIMGHTRMSTTNRYLRLAGVSTDGVTNSLNHFKLIKFNRY